MMSAVAFAMTTVPPKPSIHETIIGAYRPADAAYATSGTGVAGVCAGVVNMRTAAATRVVQNQFMTALSVINGGVECTNAGNVVQAVRRTQYYTTWLAVLGVPPARYTPDEAVWLPRGEEIGCDMCEGAPFPLLGGAPLGWKPRMNFLLDCNPEDSGRTNPDCLRTFDKATSTITGCVLGSFQDGFYNQLQYAPSADVCTEKEYKGCTCGRQAALPSCPCCTFPDAIIAVTPQAAALCANITGGLKWAPP
jgi:hypothetical protein